MSEEKNEKSDKKNVLDENQLNELEKDVENFMHFKVVRNQKTSLLDPLDILTKEPTLVPIKKQIEKYNNKHDSNISKKETKIKKYNSGLEINYFLDNNEQMELSSINKDSIDNKLMESLESSLDLNLELYIKKLYCKLNYSPIIKKIFGKKIKFEELEELSILWRFFVELKLNKDEKSISEFKDKLFKAMTENLKLVIRHIFSIIRIREGIYSIQNVFQIHYFYILKRSEKKCKEKAYDMRTTRLDPNKETSGNGATFILIKELKRTLNMLLYSTRFLFYSFCQIFSNDFILLYMAIRKMFYEFIVENCFFSTLLFNIKAIFIRSDMKEVCDEIDNLTLPFEYDFDPSLIKKEYANIEFQNSKDLLFDFKKCFDQLGYSVDKNDEKGEEVIIETEEEKKVNEIKDIDELIKYIEGDSTKKKKKKKKKKKENPINILDKLISEYKNIDDETASQSSFSFISQDSIVNSFKKDLKDMNINNDSKKIKPNFSENFLSKFD